MTKKITIAIPVFNEAAVLEKLHERLAAVADGSNHEFEFLFVNDGSSDDTLVKLTALSGKDQRVRIIDLTRNFGQQPALAAAIDRAQGDAVVLLDADLEDRPEDIAQLITAWEQGNEVVYAERGKRHVGFFKGLLFKLYHGLNAKLDMDMPSAGSFGLMDRRVIDIIKAMPEHNRYLPGLRSWAGFRQQGVSLDRGERYDNKPRVSFLRLLSLAVNSYVSFTKLPLKLASLVGLAMSLVGFGAIVFIIVYQIWLGFAVSGWASLMVTVIFASGIQLLCLGILGEYIGHILDETKGRPNYLVRTEIRQGRAE
jgi:glycosyltransferase involved in cell wall biosynthesis